MMRVTMISPMWHRAVLFALLPAAFAADDGRQPLIARLDREAAIDLEARAKTVGAIQTRTDAERRKTAVREMVLRAMNGLPKTSAPINAKVTGTLDRDGFRIEKVMFESQPDFFVTANLYVPAGSGGPFPAVLMTPGHGPSGKAGEYQLAANLARNGIAAMAYDPMSEGERLQYFDPATKKSKVGGPTGEHSQAALQSEPLGEHISRYFVWDAMRAIDYLVSRSDIDAQRIGAFGCSGGGTVTAYLAALEPRVKAAASACYITAFQDLLPSRTGVQEAEQSIPGFIANRLDFPDWIELASPKPYAVVSTTEDMFPFEGARRTFEEAKRWYGLYDAADRIQWITGPGGHGALTPVHPKIIAFFLRYLKDSTAEPVYSRVAADKPADLWCTAEGQVPGLSITDIIRKRADAVRPVKATADFRTAAGITAQPGAAPPKFTDELLAPDGPSTGPRPVVLVFAAEKPADLGKVVSSGRMVVWAPPLPWPPGAEAAKAPIQGSFYFTSLRAQLIGQTLTGLRADAMIRMVDYVVSRPDVDRKNITAYASGPSGIALLHAAAIDKRITRVVVEDSLASFRMIATEALHRNAPEYMIPGVLGHYDVADLIRAIATRPVEILNPVDATGEHVPESYHAESILGHLMK